MHVLVGVVSENGVFNAGDLSQTKSQLGQLLNPRNFRSDVNANSAINSGDIALVRSNLGSGLPWDELKIQSQLRGCRYRA